MVNNKYLPVSHVKFQLCPTCLSKDREVLPQLTLHFGKGDLVFFSLNSSTVTKPSKTYFCNAFDLQFPFFFTDFDFVINLLRKVTLSTVDPNFA